MIKIEFNKAQRGIYQSETPEVKDWYFKPLSVELRIIKAFMVSDIKSITFGCPSELVPSREEILTQLGITEQEDKLFQEQYKNV